LRTIARKRKKKQRQSYAYILIGMLALAIVFYFYLQRPADKKVGVTKSNRHSLPILEIITGKDIGKEMPLYTAEDIKPPIIKSIKFIPAEPTVLDSIKAEALTDYEKKNVIYEYLWEINNKPITDIKGDTLPTGLFKKGDAIRVSVTPFVDGIKGYTYESMFIVVHSAPPSLQLREIKQKLSNTVELQLVSKDPDGDKVMFSLEEPFLEGMTIDKETGKIIWKLKKKEEGTYKFGASATDIDGIKVIKVFEFKIEPMP
jgi:hypothetical protein